MLLLISREDFHMMEEITNAELIKQVVRPVHRLGSRGYCKADVGPFPATFSAASDGLKHFLGPREELDVQTSLWRTIIPGYFPKLVQLWRPYCIVKV